MARAAKIYGPIGCPGAHATTGLSMYQYLGISRSVHVPAIWPTSSSPTPLHTTSMPMPDSSRCVAPKVATHGRRATRHHNLLAVRSISASQRSELLIRCSPLKAALPPDDPDQGALRCPPNGLSSN